MPHEEQRGDDHIDGFTAIAAAGRAAQPTTNNALVEAMIRGSQPKLGYASV